MPQDDVNDPSRRDFLGKVTLAVGATGAAGACWPLIRSMSPSTDVLAKATTEVDLSAIPEGEAKTIAWQGKPVFVVHRSPEMIKAAEEAPPGKDPQPDDQRVQEKEWLIVLGVCTHMGCVPNMTATGWFCPCHGSVYDLSGRILRGPAPQNLEVPPYAFVDPNKVVIG